MGQAAPDSRHHVEEVQSSEHLESYFDRKLDYCHAMHDMPEQTILVELKIGFTEASLFLRQK